MTTAAYQATAHHESGHASAAALLGVVPISVQVGGLADRAGRVLLQPVDVNHATAARTP
jgi:hypothetical protein